MKGKTRKKKRMERKRRKWTDKERQNIKDQGERKEERK